MYAIRETVAGKMGRWIEHVSAGGLSLNASREHAKRYPTLEAAQAAYRRLVPADQQRFLIVCAEEDRK